MARRKRRNLYGSMSVASPGMGMQQAGTLAPASTGASSSLTAQPGGFAPQPGSVNYDLAALKYAGQHADPYEQIALNYKQAGRRFPTPEGAARSLYYADVIRESNPGYAWLAEEPYSAASVAGIRHTHFGIKAPTDPRLDYYEDARIKAEMKANYFQDEWGIAGIGYRRSGLLTSGTFEQAVPKAFPWLALEASRTTASDSAQITVVAGMSEGGSTMSRTFFLGGGFTACFLVDGYDNVSVTLDATSPGTEVKFAWVISGNQGGDLNLYRPFEVTAPMVGVAQPVPEGAYKVITAATDAAWSWGTGLIPGFAITGVTAATENPVLGSTYTPGIVNDVTWVLRPI
jgi:hypothetical protein